LVETRGEQTIPFLKVRIVLILIILIIFDKIREVPRRASGDATSLQLLNLPLFTYFVAAARAAPRGAAGHLDLPRRPVYLRVMLPKPRMSEDKFLLTQAGDSEQGAFRVVFVPQDEVDGFRDVPSLSVRGAIYIAHRDGVRQRSSG
jgi:hypothetical protein